MPPSRPGPPSRSLAGIELLESLSQEVLARAASRCRWHTDSPGERILDHLDATDDVYFIVEGEARAILYSLEGSPVTFSDLGAGETFGEYSAIDGAPRSASIEARTHCRIASMSASAFRELLASEPAVSMTLMHRMVGKIRALTTRIYEFSALAVANRIQAELLRLANMGSSSARGMAIEPAPTHADIASRTSTHREAVSRELSRLTKLGLLDRSGRVLIVKDLARLAEMVHHATGETGQ